MAVRKSAYRTQKMDTLRDLYVYGNTVAKPKAAPKKVPERKSEPETWTSPQIRRNRNRELRLSAAYVRFLALAAVCAVFVCVVYLRLQSEIVTRAENITSLQKELEELTEQNNTAYQAAEDSINLEEIRNRAINEMGMVNSAQGRVVEYEKPSEDHVIQYNEIPEDGVLAQSGNLPK